MNTLIMSSGRDFIPSPEVPRLEQRQPSPANKNDSAAPRGVEDYHVSPAQEQSPGSAAVSIGYSSALSNFSFDYDMADSKSLDRVIHRLSGESVRSLERIFALVEHFQTPTLFVDNLTAERQQTPASPAPGDSTIMDLYGSVNFPSPAYDPSAENSANVATAPPSPSLADWLADTSLDEDDSTHYPHNANRRGYRRRDSVHCALLTRYPGKKNWDSSNGCWVPKQKSRRSCGAWVLNDDKNIVASEAESPSNALSTRRVSTRPSMTTERYVPETIPLTGTQKKKKKKKLITEVEFEFEKIIGHRYEKKRWEIEVRWHGVDGTTWEPLRRFCKSNVTAQSACFRYADKNGLMNKWKGVLLNR